MAFRSSEAHLRSLFARFGIVQTCIVNIDKRHAFIKMISRGDAVSARDGMESYKSGDMQLRVSLFLFEESTNQY
jgi:protein NRD1